ncbi:MAG: alpha/beta hydrolase-fold protein [Saprospiraceae bacterium]|nr:alpha/beta hydrolase-fold protein [Saprospiraceae bacterium]
MFSPIDFSKIFSFLSCPDLTGCIAFLLLTSSLYSQVTITILDTPELTLPADSIFLASSLSNWNPADSKYMFQKLKDGTHNIMIHPPIGKFEYKCTLGSWKNVENQKNGADIPNRTIHYNGQEKKVEITIENWKEETPQKSTASKNVRILYDDFVVPQLNTTRKIWIYLPSNYSKSDAHYPVLYMHDAQNLFDVLTSFSGEWHIDETMDELIENGHQEAIIVGIENGKSSRIDEYTPWPHEKYKGGKGAEYVDFIVHTLKPHIDSTFRTKPEREYSGIMGSSLGGLISLYAAIEHQKIFGKAGIFSPSLWFSEEIFSHVSSRNKTQDIKFYFLGGGMEGETLIPNLHRMVGTLKAAGFSKKDIQLVTDPNGKHTEDFWAKEFKACYLWLFDSK